MKQSERRSRRGEISRQRSGAGSFSYSPPHQASTTSARSLAFRQLNCRTDPVLAVGIPNSRWTRSACFCGDRSLAFSSWVTRPIVRRNTDAIKFALRDSERHSHRRSSSPRRHEDTENPFLSIGRDRHRRGGRGKAKPDRNPPIPGPCLWAAKTRMQSC